MAAWCLWPAVAHARWSPQAAERIAADRDLILAAAYATDTDPAVLAAIAGHETHALPIPSTGLDADGVPLDWGVCQVRWRAWGEDLAEVGIARRPEDLLDPGLGWLAGAWVWAEKRRLYGRGKTLALRLCIYSVGSAALSYVEDCAYARAVLANLPRARRALTHGATR